MFITSLEIGMRELHPPYKNTRVLTVYSRRGGGGKLLSEDLRYNNLRVVSYLDRTWMTEAMVHLPK